MAAAPTRHPPWRGYCCGDHERHHRRADTPTDYQPRSRRRRMGSPLEWRMGQALVSSAYAGSSDGHPRYDHRFDHRGSGGYSGYGAYDGYRGNDGYRGPGGYDRYRGYSGYDGYRGPGGPHGYWGGGGEDRDPGPGGYDEDPGKHRVNGKRGACAVS